MNHGYGTISALDIEGRAVDIQIDDRMVKDVLAMVRSVGKADSRWDINLKEGQIAETELKKLLNSDAIEVKRDFGVSTTGNVAVEFMCGGKPSGISVT